MVDDVRVKQATRKSAPTVFTYSSRSILVSAEVEIQLRLNKKGIMFDLYGDQQAHVNGQ